MLVIKRIYAKIRRDQFQRRFMHFGTGSGIGSYGFGDGCGISGVERISIGDATWIGQGSEIIAMESHFSQKLNSRIIIGNHVRVTSRLRLTCAGSIMIGDDVLIAPDVFITDHYHGMNPEISGGYSPQELAVKSTVIEDGVWLGQRVCVLPGVTIGAHSIIGANSVVSKSIPPYSIAIGSPARVIKKWNFERKKWEPVFEN